MCSTPPRSAPLAPTARAIALAITLGLSACGHPGDVRVPAARPQASADPLPAPPGPVAQPQPEVTATAATTSAAPEPTVTDAQRFAAWLQAFRAQARAAGITEATLQVALADVRLRPRTLALDRAQPEFTRQVWDYLDSAASATRVANGQARLAQHRDTIEAAAARHGVPAPHLVAIWGMESNYGQNTGDVPVIDALATLAFEGRREAWARGELIAALKILQQGDIDAAHMRGSWAGAMGQTQFMPSAFLSRALDGDGDGRRDIWRSLPDVMASTANYLARAGWVSGEACAPEVRLPEGFDVARADASLRQDAAQWAAEGVQLADGGPLPPLSDAQVLLPAGARGPAFLAGPNFRAVLRYNNATSYALGVCLLAQRVAGGGALQAPWPRDERALGRSEVQALQGALRARGFDAGAPDGLLGPATRAALRAWQRSVGLPPDGFATAAQLQRLQAP